MNRRSRGTNAWGSRTAKWLAGGLLCGAVFGGAGCWPRNEPKVHLSPSDPSFADGSRSRATDGTAGREAPQSEESPERKSGEPAAAPSADEAPSQEATSDSGDSTGVSSAAAPSATGAAPSGDGVHETAEKKSPPRPAARRPSAPGEPLDISFDDLVIGMQADVVFRPWMLTDRAKEVDGQKVKLVGYIHAAVDNPKHIKEMVLLRNLECKFGPGGQADHLVRVFFKEGVKASFTKNAVEVQGVLKIQPWQGPDGNTWSLYDFEGTGFKDLNRK